MRSGSWDDTWAVIQELWPRWGPTPAQKDLWSRTFGHLDQYRLRRAADTLCLTKARLVPHAAELLAAYRAQRASSGQAPSTHGDALRRRWSQERPEWAERYAGLSDGALEAMEAFGVYQKAKQQYGANDPITLRRLQEFEELQAAAGRVA